MVLKAPSEVVLGAVQVMPTKPREKQLALAGKIVGTP
jgi:hypothetical protein